MRGYRVERLIGTGGAAAVYEARRLGPRGPGERVACKVVHAERRAASLGNAVRACIAAIILVACSPGGLARAQSGTDVSPAIPVHPDVSTILQLPERIERSWTHYGEDFRVKGVGSKVYVRPHTGTPAGTEALLEVQTRTLHRIFLLRVVARAGDARREVMVHAAPAAACVEEAARDATAAAPTPAEPAASAPCPAPAPAEPAVPPTAEEPAASAPTSAASPAAIAGPALAEPSAERDPAADMERDPATAGRARFDLAVHAVGGLGFTGVDIAGSWSERALQPHHSLGLRLTGEPRSAPWAVQADVSAEWPAGPMLYRESESGSKIEVSGPRLRLEVGGRAFVGTKWRTSAHAALGLQVHLRQAEETGVVSRYSETWEQGVVLGLGVGLQYRTRNKVLLGFDFLVRQGGPDDYHSVVVLLTAGRFLDQGD